MIECLGPAEYLKEAIEYRCLTMEEVVVAEDSNGPEPHADDALLHAIFVVSICLLLPGVVLPLIIQLIRYVGAVRGLLTANALPIASTISVGRLLVIHGVRAVVKHAGPSLSAVSGARERQWLRLHHPFHVLVMKTNFMMLSRLGPLGPQVGSTLLRWDWNAQCC